MTQACQSLDLKVVCQICQTLEKIVYHSFGPRGSKTLLATETGQVVITSDGNVVLRRLHFSHPVAKLIIDSMTRTVNFTGDGSKTFILYISQFFQEFEHFEHSGNINGRNTYVIALQKIKLEIIENLFIFLVHKVPQMIQNVSSEIIQPLLKTCLSNSFPEKTVDHFVLLISNLLAGHNEDLREHIQNILENVDQMFIKIPNLPYTESKTISSFIIQRNFAIYNPIHSSCDVHFVICLFPICGHEKNFETREIIQLKSDLAMNRFMDHHQKLLQNFVELCKSNNIGLLLCASQVSNEALHLFQQSGISIVHHVPEEDCHWLLKELKIYPCTSMLEKFETKMFGKAQSCKPLIINGRQCVHLDFRKDLPKMLLLCAPTEGLCNQVFLTLQKCLKCLLTCFCDNFKETNGNLNVKSTVEKIAVVAGGGTFEFLVSDFLLEISDQYYHPSVKLICNCLQKALMWLPQALFHNNSPSKDTHLKNYLISLQEIGKLKYDGKYVGFDRNGHVSDLFKNGILTPAYLKIHLLLSVIELAQQILRIDAIVGVKRMNQDEQ